MDGRDDVSVWSGEPPQLSERELLEWCAGVSDRAAATLQRVQFAEAEAKAKARRDPELLEFVAAISGKPEHERQLRELIEKEAKEREAWWREGAFHERYVADMSEWNPDQPRVPVGSPQGGQWSKGGVGGLSAGGPPSHLGLMPQHNRGFADHTSEPATTGNTAAMAQFTGDHVPVHLTAAARARVGHHWVPQGVFKPLKDRMTQDAFDIFMLGTESTGAYNHAFDPWKGVKHREYSEAMAELLKDWIAKTGNKLEAKEASQFLSWIATGECKDGEFLAKHKALFDTVFKWRSGFNQSIVIAARAAEINPTLTPAELKAIAQQVVNGAPTKSLSEAAAKTLQTIVADGKAALKATAKKVLPGLMFLSAAMAAKRGWAGEGRYGDGAWAAASEVLRDLVSADTVEQIVFPKMIDTVGGLVDLVVPGLKDPTKKRYLRRHGHVYDMETGQQIH
ncbi:MAG TPA: hypothetical protein VHY91_10200 [Pirellulales bacterium]|jgi:hypothetical protein|nr:hypothetical protein [Pirellulales bacterium]